MTLLTTGNRDVHLVRTLESSSAKTATGTGSSVRIPNWVNAVVFELDVTAAATDVDDTLDVTIQTKVDGTNWLDVVAFTQVKGNGGAKRYIAKVIGNAAESMFENGSSLSAGNVRDILGDEFRAKWTIADPSGTNVSFTFSVTAIPM